MQWYRPRDVASSLILVASLIVVLVYTATYLSPGPLRPVIWVILFLIAGGLAPAPWVVPPASIAGFLIAVAVTPSAEGGCPAGELCEPVSASEPFLFSLGLIALSTTVGAAARSLYEYRRRRARKTAEAELPP